MTPEDQARRARVDAAKADLRAAMSRLPFDLNSADATRIDLWRIFMGKARTALNRNADDPVVYEECARAIRACKSEPLASLVKGAYNNNSGPI